MRKVLISIFVLAVAAIAMPAFAADTDGDGIWDQYDNCPAVRNGNCSAYLQFCDINGDSVVTLAERIAGNQSDWNANGLGDACEDYDEDGILDYLDNCPGVENADQDPSACSDFDGDKVYDDVDNCLEDYNPGQDDRDADGIGDSCDNCRLVPNPGQEDSDDDGFGDACISDADGDGVPDADDNCPTVPNPAQEDTGGTSRGDACELNAGTSESPFNTDNPRYLSTYDSSRCDLIQGAAAGTGNLASLWAVVAALAAIAGSRRRR